MEFTAEVVFDVTCEVERQGVSLDDLIDFTPALRAEAVELVSKYRIGPIFTPPSMSRYDGPLATLMLPRATGGANWQGGSLDPETNILYVFSNTSIWAMGLVHAPERSDMDFVQGLAPDPASPGTGSGVGRFPRLTIQGLPLVKPPWGRIVAIDMNAGEHLWTIPNGPTPQRTACVGSRPPHGATGEHPP